MLLCWLAALCYGGWLRAAETALDRYVEKPDPTFSWRVEKTIEGNLKTFVVRMKSQTWRDKADVDRPEWEHCLMVVKPEKTTSKTAFLLIGGGGNDGKPPKGPDSTTLEIARLSNSVVAELRQVPNQPLVFHGDGKPRKEDDLICYTWDQFLRTGDETWPARLPMVKSAVRAMDCVQELLRSDEGGGLAIERFVVAGGSKRGWTTWCTAAVDRRVEAIVPIVIDVLNLTPSIRHHAAAYGFYAEAIDDYYNHRILQRLDDPRMRELMAIEDPYSYRDRLTMPKYLVNAAGDQFFCPDSSQFYFDDLVGEKHLRYVPNTDHSLKDSDAVATIIAFYQMVLSGKPRPEYSWSFEADGSIRVAAKTPPKKVLLWHATNPAARDFRLEKIGKAYTSEPLTETQAAGAADGQCVYVGRVAPPEKGWTAFFVELTFDSGTPLPLKVTTAVRVLPDVLPHANLDPLKVPREATVGEKR
jgi:PhoPQ-activated pathogenicity-related protein